MYDVYWIRLETDYDIYSQGYVGFSGRTEKRWEEHFASRYLVGTMINENQDSVVFGLVDSFETIEEAKELEKHLRPQPHIGWNIAKGGQGGRQPDSVLKTISEKVKQQHQDIEWRKTVWEPTLEKRNENISKTMNDEEWKKSVGYDAWKRAGSSIAKTMNDEEWKKTKGVERIEGQKKTKSDPKWKEKNRKVYEEKSQNYSGSGNPKAKKTKFKDRVFGTKKEAYAYGKSIGLRWKDIDKEIKENN